MKIQLFFLSALISLSLFAQENPTPCIDKIDFENPNFFNSNVKGLYLISIEQTQCDDSKLPNPKANRISAIDTLSDTLIFTIQYARNCCMASLVSVKIVDSNTLNFEFKDDSTNCGQCFCWCCFSAYVTVINESNSTFNQFQFNGDSLPFSKEELNIYQEHIEYWPNGKMKSKITTGYTTNLRVWYDSSGKKTLLEYIDENGKVLRKTEF